MAVSAQIEQDISTAMKEGSADRVAVLRLLKSSFKNEQIKLGHELGDDEVMKVLQREAKQRRDSIDAYEQASRPELAAVEKAELEIITSYLPQQMEAAELAAIVDGVIKETGATSAAEMGVVIGAVMKQVAGKADGAAVSAVVRQKLNG